MGAFELDNVPKNLPGPYTVTILFANGTVYEQPFDLSEPRPQPDKPFELCDKSEVAYWDWQEYYRYQEGLLHLQKQHEAYCDYCERVAAYIRANCILTEIDFTLITADDWRAIYHAAICPQVTMEDIAAAMRHSFRGRV